MKQNFFSRRRSLIFLSAVIGIFMIAALMSFSNAPDAGAAAPLAGTVIGNQASATYTDASLINRTATSNTVITTVQQVASFTLTANQSKIVAPGGTVYYPHTLTNTGNGSDSFNLTAVDANTGAINLTVYIYADADGNGVPDNSTAISSTGSIASGTSFKFIVAAVVPGTATNGQTETVTVTGTSVFDNGVTQTNTDTVTVTGNAVINVTKSLSVISGPSPSTSNITVTLTYTNTGNSTATAVTITDTIGTGSTAGMAYVLNSGTWSGGATVTDAAGGDSAGLEYDWNITAPNRVTAVVSSIAPATSGTITLQVSINSGLAPGTSTTSNKASYSYNDGSGDVGPYDSNTAVYTVVQTGGTVANGSGASSVDGTGEPVTVASAAQGSTVLFTNYIWNTGNGTDSFDITISGSSFPAGTTFQLYQADGVTPLTDSNGNGISDTGPVAPGAYYAVILNATLPANATGGPFSVTKTSASFFDSSKTNTVTDTLTSISSSTVDMTNNTARTDSTPAGTANAGNAATTGWGAGPEVSPVTTNTVNPGGTTTFVLVINNTSSVADSYDLLADQDTTFGAANDLLSGWSAVFKRDNSGAARDCSVTGATVSNTGVINAGANRVLCAIITLPAAQAAGDQELYFRARSSTTGAVDSKHDRVTVNAVRSVVASPSNSGQIYPGGTVVYTHLLSNTGNVVEGDGTGSTITLSRTDSLAGAGWSSVIYFDLNNNGALDATDPTVAGTVHTLGGTLADGLGIGESARFFMKVFAPAGAAIGDIDTTTLTATTANGTYTSTVPAVSSAQDTSQVIAGQVRMEKTQALDVACDGTPDAAFSSATISAAPGVCIRYQIVATNDGTAAIASLVASDSTPANTTYDDGSRNSAQGACGTGAADAPAATTQGTITAPACNSTGTVQATVGTLNPSQSVTITFGVMINY
jgi:uncharacterized repeat protein (TIGR01451 family)